jgi:DNA mismatch endonuclease (patch repair protein)
MDILARAERSARMALIRSVDSKFELRVRSALHRRGYRYRKHDRRLPGKPDLVFVSRRKVIFLHGCFWHGHRCRLGRMPKSRSQYWVPKISGNRLRDGRNLKALRALGWSVLTVWECELDKFDRLVVRIKKFLGGRPDLTQVDAEPLGRPLARVAVALDPAHAARPKQGREHLYTPTMGRLVRGMLPDRERQRQE